MGVVYRSVMLKGIEVMIEIGVHDFEQGVRQRVIVDVEAKVDGRFDFSSNRLEDVFDYDIIRNEVLRLAACRQYRLQETFCSDIAEAALRCDGVLSVRVRTHKPDVYQDCEYVGVEVMLEK